jgi:hypothetical protein
MLPGGRQAPFDQLNVFLQSRDALRGFFLKDMQRVERAS